MGHADEIVHIIWVMRVKTENLFVFTERLKVSV